MSVRDEIAARTIRCAGCSSPIEIVELSPSIRCAHCGRQQQLDQQLLDELGSYRDRVDDQLEQARQERVVAEAWERSTDQIVRGTKLRGYLLAFGLLAGLPLAAILVGIALIQQGVIPQSQTVIVNWMAMGATAVAVTLYYTIYFARHRRRRASASAVGGSSIRCPECGAASRLAPGQILERCVHCGAALVPPVAVRAEAVDAVRQARRRAALEKYRAERAGYAALRGVGLGPIALIGFIGGSFLLMTGGGSLAFSWLMLTGDEPYSPAIFAMWGVTIALIAGMVVAIRTVRGRQARARSALDRLARSLGGYRILVDVNPIAASQHHRAYSVMLLAGEVPVGEDDVPLPLDDAARRIERRISAAGYEVEIVEAGLIARAGDDLLPRLKQPESIATLAEPIADLARLAAALGAAPVN